MVETESQKNSLEWQLVNDIIVRALWRKGRGNANMLSKDLDSVNPKELIPFLEFLRESGIIKYSENRGHLYDEIDPLTRVYELS